MASIAQNLFRISALLNAISIPGHTGMGFDLVYPAIAQIPSLPKNMIGKCGAQVCWNQINASLLVKGKTPLYLVDIGTHIGTVLLNWHWSRTIGPQTTEEKIILWTISVAGAISGYRYWQVSSYPPLICLVVAPTCSLVGWWVI